ncbi:MAG: SMP-30/gluconolactonase/LRE family protein [Anaerolineales bacterium]
MQLSPPKLLLDVKAELGEGPSWDATRECLYWVDVYAGHLHVYNPHTGEDNTHVLEKMIGCVAPARSGKLMLALRDGLATLDLSTDRVTFLAQPKPALPGNRFNDGKCGPDGRFVAGSMDQAEKENTGSLYSLSPNGTMKTLIAGVGISNGITWSPDHKTFYFIDTPTRKVMAYDYDLDSGEIANPRVAVSVPAEFGWPDGMTSDTKGRLWVALWGGAALSVWEPGTGQLVERIRIPAKNVSSCVFGGSGRNQLYVTSARKGLDQADLTAYPATGGLFRLETDVEGMPTFEFGD